MAEMNSSNNICNKESDVLSGLIQPTLLSLPLEIRRCMYSYVFHRLGWNENKGCHCGDNLSITNRQLYLETRPLVYGYAKPRFLDAESCLRFLRDIKENTFHIKSLSIIDRENSSESYRLADVFRYPGIEGLEEFKYNVRTWRSLLELSQREARRRVNRPPPVYSLVEERNSPAVVYDMDLRVSRHPLAELKHLRKLKVDGFPQSEIEEAIFRASRNIEELGRREGKRVMRLEKPNDHPDRYALDQWSYNVQILDDGKYKSSGDRVR